MADKDKPKERQKSTFVSFGFGGNSPRYQHKTRKMLRNMARECPRKYSDALLAKVGPERAAKLAADTLAACERGIGGELTGFVTGEEIRRNYGFWMSAARYLDVERRKERARRKREAKASLARGE